MVWVAELTGSTPKIGFGENLLWIIKMWESQSKCTNFLPFSTSSHFLSRRATRKVDTDSESSVFEDFENLMLGLIFQLGAHLKWLWARSLFAFKLSCSRKYKMSSFFSFQDTLQVLRPSDFPTTGGGSPAILRGFGVYFSTHPHADVDANGSGFVFIWAHGKIWERYLVVESRAVAVG